jgi:hypothetical protein
VHWHDLRHTLAQIKPGCTAPRTRRTKKQMQS